MKAIAAATMAATGEVRKLWPTSLSSQRERVLIIVGKDMPEAPAGPGRRERGAPGISETS